MLNLLHHDAQLSLSCDSTPLLINIHDAILYTVQLVNNVIYCLFIAKNPQVENIIWFYAFPPCNMKNACMYINTTTCT